MTIGKGKRPRDPNQLAAWTIAVSTGQTEASMPDIDPVCEANDSPPKVTGSPSSEVSAYMAAIGRKGGEIGGKRRLTTMTKEERSKIAKKAANARWKKAKRKP